MTTAALVGKAGSVSGQSGGVEITEWSHTLTTELVEASSMSSGGNREWIQGLTGGEGSFTAIGSNVVVGSVTTLTLKCGSTGALQLSGAALVESTEVSNPVEGRIEYSASFKYTGAITVGAVTS
jgi:hypothetical protein